MAVEGEPTAQKWWVPPLLTRSIACRQGTSKMEGAPSVHQSVSDEIIQKAKTPK